MGGKDKIQKGPKLQYRGTKSKPLQTSVTIDQKILEKAIMYVPPSDWSRSDAHRLNI